MPGPLSTINTRHTHWGSTAGVSDLPNVLGSATQDPRLAAGDTCWLTDVGAQYVCEDPTLGAAVWVRQANSTKRMAWNQADLLQFSAIETFGGAINPQATPVIGVNGSTLVVSMDLGSPVGAGAVMWFNDPIEFGPGMDIRYLLNMGIAPAPVTPDNMLCGIIVAGPGPGGAGTGVLFVAGSDALTVTIPVQVLVANAVPAGFLQDSFTQPATGVIWCEWKLNGELRDQATFPPNGIPVYVGTMSVSDFNGANAQKGTFLINTSGFAGPNWGIVPSNRVGIVWMTFSGVTASPTASLGLNLPSIDRFDQGRE